MGVQRTAMFAALLGAAASPVWAVSLPDAIKYDARLRQVVYNERDVVQIQGAYGTSTNITFGDNEEVLHTALGDSTAWQVAKVGNHLFLKPTASDAHTNMTVITSRRVYQFDLAVTSDSPYYGVWFAYPEQERREAQLRAEEAALRAELAELQRKQAEMQKAQEERLANTIHDAEIPVRHNINYWAKGSDEVVPNEAFDDGQFTYFRFSGNREFPTIYLETEGEESLINTTVRGDTIVVQRMAPRFVLRKGNSVALVVNPDYDAVGIGSPSGTITPAVMRDVLGERDPVIEPLPTEEPTSPLVPALVPLPRQPTRTVSGPDDPAGPALPPAPLAPVPVDPQEGPTE